MSSRETIRSTRKNLGISPSLRDRLFPFSVLWALRFLLERSGLFGMLHAISNAAANHIETQPELEMRARELKETKIYLCEDTQISVILVDRFIDPGLHGTCDGNAHALDNAAG